MKNRLVLVPVAAVLLLLVGIAARHDLMLRTAVVCVGILVTLAGMGIAAARKSSRKYLLELAVILAAYVLYAGTGFQTTDLGARSEEHTSETPVTYANLVCRLLLGAHV